MRRHTIIGVVIAVAAIAGSAILVAPQFMPDGGERPSAVDPVKDGNISVRDARLVLPDTAGEEGALYLTVTNNSPRHVFLNEVAVDNAASAVFRAPRAGGATRLANIDLAPGQTLKLAQDGRHIGVSGYSEEVVPGRTVEVQLRLDDATVVTAPATVEADTRQE